MAKIENLFNGDGESLYPLTHIKAVINDSGESLDQILGDGLELANQGYKFMGIATPNLIPLISPTTDKKIQRMYWEASTPGTYTHFGHLVVNEGETAYLILTGISWEKIVSHTIVNDLTTGGANKSLSAEMGKELNTGYQYIGIATPTTRPITTVAKIYYEASESGTYSNFGGLVVNQGEAVYLKWDGSTWSKEVKAKGETVIMEETKVVPNGVPTDHRILIDTMSNMVYFGVRSIGWWKVSAVPLSGASIKYLDGVLHIHGGAQVSGDTLVMNSGTVNNKVLTV